MSFKNSGNFCFCYVGLVGLCDALASIVHIVFCIVINLKKKNSLPFNLRRGVKPSQPCLWRERKASQAVPLDTHKYDQAVPLAWPKIVASRASGVGKTCLQRLSSHPLARKTLTNSHTRYHIEYICLMIFYI